MLRVRDRLLMTICVCLALFERASMTQNQRRLWGRLVWPWSTTHRFGIETKAASLKEMCGENEERDGKKRWRDKIEGYGTYDFTTLEFAVPRSRHLLGPGRYPNLQSVHGQKWQFNTAQKKTDT